MKHRNTLRHDDQGFASIVVALTIIIVLGLLAVGFSQLARREQQSALDKQLSTQAYYAAETGINDTQKYLNDPNVIGTLGNLNTEQCLTGPAISATNNLPGNSGASYTCVIANTRPQSLEYKGVPADTSKVVNFQAINSAGTPVQLSSLKIEWESDGNSFPASKQFLPSSDWSSNGFRSVIQFALTPYKASTANHDSLVAATSTNYLFPNNNPSNTISYPSSGGISNGGCDANKCTVIINNINSAPADTDNYMIHFINMYRKSNITITGTSTAGGAVNFDGGQAMIDVTGKSRNVLKRLRVRVPLTPRADVPGYIIEAQNICKTIETEPDNTEFKIPSGAGPDGNSCKLDE